MPSVRVGEGAALKAVGLKGLAGSNPVDGAKNPSHQKRLVASVNPYIVNPVLGTEL